MFFKAWIPAVAGMTAEATAADLDGTAMVVRAFLACPTQPPKRPDFIFSVIPATAGIQGSKWISGCRLSPA
jgi:hypothetical protein